MKEITDFKEPLEIGNGGFAEESPGVILHKYDFSNIDKFIQTEVFDVN